MSLDLSKVQPADVILTMGPSTTSKLISSGTCGPVSHAILALKNGFCIESISASGVAEKPLAKALHSATKATLYRHKWINSDAVTRVCYHAMQALGKPYDKFGAVRSGVSSGCSSTKLTVAGMVVILAHEINQKGSHDDKFFCSELVAYAFEKANVPLTSKPFHTITPAEIMRSDKLDQVEVLIA